MSEKDEMFGNFNNMIPRSIFVEADPEFLDRKAATFTGLAGTSFNAAFFPQYGGNSLNIYRNPARRFYDPEITTTAIFLPRNIRQKNRWCRWFHDHDEMIGAVLELHAELPHSRAEIIVDDPLIKRHVEECFERTRFYSMLPLIDLEFMKIGEVFIYNHWDSSKGMWSHIIIHNPDFVEVTASPFADTECVIEIKPDEELKSIVHSTRPEDQRLKRKLPKEIIRRVLTGKNIVLDSDEVTHIARRSNPYDIRGTSILNRIFRCYVPGTKVRCGDGTVKAIEDVKINDSVYSIRGNLRKVVDTVFYDVDTSLVSIKPYEFEGTLCSTFGHKYKIGRNSSIITLEAEKINEGDYLLIPIDKKVRSATIKNNETARFLGYIVGLLNEGLFEYVNKQIRMILKMDQCGKDDFLYILQEEFPDIEYDLNVYEYTYELLIRDSFHTSFIIGFLYEYISSLQKDFVKLLTDFLSFSTDIQMSFLDGFLSVVVGKSYNNDVTIPLFSTDLAYQIQWLLFRNRIFSKIITEFDDSLLYISSNFVNYLMDECVIFTIINKIDYSFYTSLLQYYRYIEYNDFIQLLKNYIDITDKRSDNSIYIDDDFFYVKIESIDIAEYQGRVYDLTVDVDHWWLCGGNFVTSNTLMYEDKLREAQLTIADNFIYPLKLFKLGDPQKGWIPDETHQRAIAQMLEHANMDPNFSLIYHYGLQVEYITVADKVMRLEKEWDEINKRKMVALGVSQEFMEGKTTYASANVALQTQLARYKAKRDLFEIQWIQNKFLRIMAERNGWYKRDAREILGSNGPYLRFNKTGEERRRRLIIPKMLWHKKLMLRDDQQYLTFLNNVYAQGKGPISAITLLLSMGLNFEEELYNKDRQKELEQMIGVRLQPTSPAGPPGGLPGLGPLARLKDRFKKGKKNFNETKEKIVNEDLSESLKNTASSSKEFIKHGQFAPTISRSEHIYSAEEKYVKDLLKDALPASYLKWKTAIRSPKLSMEVIHLFDAFSSKLDMFCKKYSNIWEGLRENKDAVLGIFTDLYLQGKLTSYSKTGFLPLNNDYYARDNNLRDYSDIVLSNEFESWLDNIEKAAIDDDIRDYLCSAISSCFYYGQLKGFQEQGVYNIRLSNSLVLDGVHYNVNDLLKKGQSLSSIISPEGEIVLMVPCIEGYDGEEFGNFVDKAVHRYKNGIIDNIEIIDCPVEYYPFVETFISKLGKYLKRSYNNVIFIKDVVYNDRWQMERKKAYEEQNPDMKDSLKHQWVTASLNYEITAKCGKIPVYRDDKVLYVSNWIGMEDNLITDALIKYIPFEDESLRKTILKNFKRISYDLTEDEINTYKIFGYIEPLFGSTEEIDGWVVSSNLNCDEIDNIKLSSGKVWDKYGKCIDTSVSNAMQLFRDNLYMWLEYPHKLSKDLREMFELL